MRKWDILYKHLDTILEGFYKTLILFGVSVVVAGIIGVVIIFLLERDEKSVIRRMILLVVDVMRMLPFLIFVYLLYYGLPKFGIRMDAWTVGLVGLSVYHGAYVAEILRGLRATLPRGQIDAALSHGYSKMQMMRYLVVPQLLYSSGPLIGNQLIYLLKDTAFLTIITVQELTGAAASVQSTYFIPVQAFVVAIALYWIVSIGIEFAMRLVDRAAKKRGIGND